MITKPCGALVRRFGYEDMEDFLMKGSQRLLGYAVTYYRKIADLDAAEAFMNDNVSSYHNKLATATGLGQDLYFRITQHYISTLYEGFDSERARRFEICKVELVECDITLKPLALLVSEYAYGPYDDDKDRDQDQGQDGEVDSQADSQIGQGEPSGGRVGIDDADGEGDAVYDEVDGPVLVHDVRRGQWYSVH